MIHPSRQMRLLQCLPNGLLALGACWLLAVGFSHNRWGVVEPRWFESHQRDTEAHVIGRMVQSRQGGLWSFAGFNGVGVERSPGEGVRRWPPHHTLMAQTTAYRDGTSFPFYDPYLSQPGGQGWLFGMADACLPIGSERKLELFHGFTAWMTAAMLAAVVLWLKSRLGWTAAACALASMLWSPWLVVFGKNLWWSLWSFYLPLLALAAVLSICPPARLKWWVLAAVSLAAVFLKCLLTGNEYITTTLLMAAVPVVFSLCRDWPGWRRGVTMVASFVGGSLTGVALGLLVLCVQLAALNDRVTAGVDHVRFSFAKRAWGDPERYPERAQQYRTPLATVLDRYQQGICYDLDAAGGGVDRPKASFFRPFRFGQLIRWLFVPTVLLLLAACTPRGRPHRRLIVAAVVSTWFSLAAPYSWFIVFKPHSIEHYHMNYVCWHMPFTFLAAALFGFAASVGLGLLLKHPTRPVESPPPTGGDSRQTSGT